MSSSHHSSFADHYSAPQSRYTPHQSSHRSSTLPGTGINSTRPVEVYHLSDSANASIPEDIREQFQRDEQGHVLFFTTPPLDVLPPTKPGGAIGHTARYLAAKVRRKIALAEKQKAATTTSTADLPDLSSDGPAPKRAKAEGEDDDDAAASFAAQVAEMKNQAVDLMVRQMDQGTEALCKDLYGEHWAEGMRIEREKVAKAQAGRMRQLAELEAGEARRREKTRVSLMGNGVYLDDFDPRY